MLNLKNSTPLILLPASAGKVVYIVAFVLAAHSFKGRRWEGHLSVCGEGETFLYAVGNVVDVKGWRGHSRTALSHSRWRWHSRTALSHCERGRGHHHSLADVCGVGSNRFYIAFDVYSCDKLFNGETFRILGGSAFALGEEAVANVRESYDIATSRAVARLNILLELTAPFVKVGGFVLAMKGTAAMEELEEAKKAIKTLGLKLEEVREFPVDGTAHTVIVLKKVAPTPAKFPRRYAKIKQAPL